MSIREKIDAVNNSFVKAFNKGDISKAMEVYTSNATILPPNAPMMQGKEAIIGFWKGAVEMGVKEAQLETVNVTPMGKDAACEVGNYVLKIQPEGSPVITDKGKYLMIWKLDEGVWKWDTDAWNSSLPAP